MIHIAGFNFACVMRVRSAPVDGRYCVSRLYPHRQRSSSRFAYGVSWSKQLVLCQGRRYPKARAELVWSFPAPAPI